MRQLSVDRARPTAAEEEPGALRTERPMEPASPSPPGEVPRRQWLKGASPATSDPTV
jgi:hypothetical protein